MAVAEDVDRSDLGEIALVNLENDIDPVLIELDDLRFDPGGEPSLAAVELEDAIDVRAHGGAGEDLPRRELDLRRNLVFLKVLVALEDDAIDHRVLANGDDQVPGVATGD